MLIERRYRDGRGEIREAPQETVDAVRAIVGDEEPPGPPSPQSAAARCWTPERRLRALAVQVYSLWSGQSAGIGDLGDLAALAAGAPHDLLLLNPLHATHVGTPQEPSPYFPSSRQFRNPLYLRVGVPQPASADGRIDRDRVWAAKMGALEERWGRFQGDAGFDAFREREADELVAFASFCALSEKFGRPWTEWPVEYRRPGGHAVRAFGVAHADRVRFHEWLQWQLDEQMAAAAAAGTGLVNDVAVGFDGTGADAWRWQDIVATGMRVGAPPDEFNRDGQDWGVPPFAPGALARVGYRPIAAALRAAFRHAAGIRIDHVMGLFRLFWIPEGASPRDGVYVHDPSSALLDIVAAESKKARALVVGEDLGTVDPAVRAQLRQRGVLSYRLLWFEDDALERWPAQALAAVSTHDLPTIAGVWEGTDGSPDMRARLVSIAGADAHGIDDVVAAVHAALRRTPSTVVAEQVEDILGLTERTNLPGTVDARNWSRRLPVDVGALVERLRAASG